MNSYQYYSGESHDSIVEADRKHILIPLGRSRRSLPGE